MKNLFLLKKEGEPLNWASQGILLNETNYTISHNFRQNVLNPHNRITSLEPVFVKKLIATSDLLGGREEEGQKKGEDTQKQYIIQRRG